MYKIIILIVIIGFSFFGLIDVHAQEVKLATFQETAQVFFDQLISQNVTASITLQSTSNQEIRIPSELEQKIRENGRIIAVILTNEEQCVLGVQDDACILINISRDESEKGIFAIQDAAKEIGNSIIDDVNRALDTNAKFHSVYIHTAGETNLELETSGVVSGKGTVSVTYTMPKEDTNSMYEKISAILIPSAIRESGGFYDIAKKLSSEDNAAMTFSILPKENSSLYQIKLSVDYPGLSNYDLINPLEFLKTNELKRSSYFSNDFYPLNSILIVVILSSEVTSVNEVNANIVPSQVVDGEKIPTDLSIDGWIFDPESGNKIVGKYLFGEKFSVSKNDLLFTLGSAQLNVVAPTGIGDFDSSLLIVIIIVILSGGAAVFYMKGYKKG
ncbi:MAG: hypothetical protein NPMRTHETA2_640001 [Nitrosopumilales archaeon]|nr:MAG: hypothetical protein NPMRTHETA2_640001 [Nitrosopumilales archaeon]